MAMPFMIVRVNELPSNPSYNSLYVVRRPDKPDRVDLVFTGSTHGQITSTLTFNDAKEYTDSSIEAALNDRREVRVYDDWLDIKDMKPRYNVFAYVKESSADPRAKSGSAFYIFDLITDQWILLSSSGNTAMLQLLSENPEGRLEFKGELVTTVKFVQSDW